MVRFVAALICLALVALSGCATTSNDDSGPGISPKTALTAMDRFVADPIGNNAKAYLSIAVNYVEKNDDTLVSVDTKYFPAEYLSLHMDNKSHLLGAYVAGNARYQLRNSVVEDRPGDGIRVMIRTYRALVNAGRMRQYESFNGWLQQNNLD